MTQPMRRRITLTLGFLAAAGWAVCWVPLGLGMFSTWAEYGWSPSQVWLRQLFPVRIEALDGARLLVIGVLPAIALAWLRRPGVAGRLRMTEWRPERLLAGWLAVLAAAVPLLGAVEALPMRQCTRPAPWSLTFCGAGPAYVVTGSLGAALVLLLRRRLGPVAEWSPGALLGFAATTLWASGPLLALPPRLFPWWHPGEPTHTLAVQLPHWLLVAALVGLTCRWISARPGRKPAGAYAAGALGTFALALLMLGLLNVPMLIPLLLLALTAAAHAVWRWSERGALPAPAAIRLPPTPG